MDYSEEARPEDLDHSGLASARMSVAIRGSHHILHRMTVRTQRATVGTNRRSAICTLCNSAIVAQRTRLAVAIRMHDLAESIHGGSIPVFWIQLPS